MCNKGGAPYTLHVQLYRQGAVAGAARTFTVGSTGTWSGVYSGFTYSCSGGIDAGKFQTVVWLTGVSGGNPSKESGDKVKSCTKGS